MQIWHGNANEDSGRHNIEATSYVQVMVEHPKSSMPDLHQNSSLALIMVLFP